MDAKTRTLQDVMLGDRQFRVPAYQRPYIWDQETQWEPLWDDVECTAERLGQKRTVGFDQGLDIASADRHVSPHFLGAVVIDHQDVPTGDLETRMVVDGQQRLTTIQLLLRGVLDALEELGTTSQGRARIRKAIYNDADVVDASEMLKVVPRDAERASFDLAMEIDVPAADESKFAAARTYFSGAAKAFLVDDAIQGDPYLDGNPVDSRASLLVASLLGLIKLVVIDLEDEDDAQIIFESLNARGTPLTAADLVKNLLFMRAEAQHLDTNALYEDHWKRFDDDEWWLEQRGLGHAQRARLDWLLGDWLIAELGRTVSVSRLYGEFRQWLEETETGASEALASLSKHATAYEALNGRVGGTSVRELKAYQNIEALNITVATPLLLNLLVLLPGDANQDKREKAILAIEAYVVRRMLNKAQTRAYGNVFVDVLKAVKKDATRPSEAAIAALRSGPHSYEWPSLDDLEQSFETSRYYGSGGISQARLRLVLGTIDAHIRTTSNMAENGDFDYSALQVEHVIPQTWRETWPVVEGDEDPIAAEQLRDRAVNRIGNLTLASGPLNASLSNNPWEAKRNAIQEHSGLVLNRLLLENSTWNEELIAERGKWLARQVEAIWPGPSSSSWTL